MKTLMLCFVLAVGAIATSKSYGQTVNGAPLKELDVDYLLIVGMVKLSGKVAVAIDFGQRDKLFSATDDGKITDETGKQIAFNSMIDALNFLSKYGYEFISGYTVTYADTEYAYHWMLKKKIDDK